ncbi:putative reverse transcriptase domain-containing protein [Tanacetum coccineum]
MKTSRIAFAALIPLVRNLDDLGRSFSQDIASDVTVNAGGVSFSLHKFPLVSKCGCIRKFVSDPKDVNVFVVDIPDVPRGPEEYLEMTEDYAIGNLVSRSEFNLSIDTIAFIVTKESHFSPSGGTTGALITSTSSSSQPKPVVDWWAEDLIVLRFDIFQRVLLAMISRGFKQYVLGPILMLYAQKCLRGSKSLLGNLQYQKWFLERFNAAVLEDEVAGLAIVFIICFTTSSVVAFFTNISVLYCYDWQSIGGIYASLLLILYFFIGLSVPSAFVLWIMREVPPSMTISVADSVALFSRAPFTLLASYSLLPHYLIKVSLLAMSSDNASSAVTYTSVSSDSNGPSWGIPLVNADELPEMDPYKESTGYIADLNSMEEDSIDYPDKPEDDYEDPEEDDNEDPEEDPSEEHDLEDDDEDPSEEHDPKDEGTKEEEPSEGSDETESFKEDETALIDAFAAGSPLFPLPPTSPAYDQALLGHRAAMIRMRDDIHEEDMPPQRRFVLTASLPGCDVAESFVATAARALRGQYDFVDTVEAGQGLICSPGHNARAITRAADRVEDVGYVRALQASEHRMMTSIEEINLRVSYQAQVRRDIRLEIDVVRGQRTAYETELHETLETHMSRMEWQRQSAEDRAVKQMMRTQVLEARARIDTVEDAGSSC